MKTHKLITIFISVFVVILLIGCDKDTTGETILETPYLVYTGDSFPGSPSFSPDGARIAFNTTTAIRIAEVYNENVTTLYELKEGYHVHDLDWSPDGTRIAFTTKGYGEDEIGIYSIPIDGGEPTLIMGTGHNDHVWISWSPDSQKIVYSMNGLHIVDVDTRETQEIYPDDNTQFVDWDPNGDFILFTLDHKLYTIPVNGGNPTQIEGTTAADLAISPDGSWVVFRKPNGGHYDEIWAMRISGGDQYKVDHGLNSSTTGVDWSPGGTYILYRRKVGGIWLNDAPAEYLE